MCMSFRYGIILYNVHIICTYPIYTIEQKRWMGFLFLGEKRKLFSSIHFLFLRLDIIGRYIIYIYILVFFFFFWEWDILRVVKSARSADDDGYKRNLQFLGMVNGVARGKWWWCFKKMYTHIYNICILSLDIAIVTRAKYGIYISFIIHIVLNVNLYRCRYIIHKYIVYITNVKSKARAREFSFNFCSFFSLYITILLLLLLILYIKYNISFSKNTAESLCYNARYWLFNQ